MRDFNIAVQTIPRSVLASAFGFQPGGYFEIEAEDRSAVHISSSPLQAGTAATPQLPPSSTDPTIATEQPTLVAGAMANS